MALWPVKMFPTILLDNEESQHREGTRAYVTFIKWIGGYAENFEGWQFCKSNPLPRVLDHLEMETTKTTGLIASSPLPCLH